MDSNFGGDVFENAFELWRGITVSVLVVLADQG
jgi:hypothetical protein